MEPSRIVVMIDPNAINPFLLPSVALENRSCLPNTPCIYFAIDSLGQIQYIGRSINPCQRWNGHHRYNELSEMRGVKIAYFSVDSAELLPSIESALIQWFDPPLNIRGRSHQTQRKFNSGNCREIAALIDELIDEASSLSPDRIALLIDIAKSFNLAQSKSDRARA